MISQVYRLAIFVTLLYYLIMKFCNECPRSCGVNREKSCGWCKVPSKFKIAKIMLHPYEEPTISGTGGAGAIFFAGCSLGCIYCQNYEISSGKVGELFTKEQLIDAIKDLEKRGASCIDLVTPTHYTDELIDVFNRYKPSVPIVWNSSGYETVEEIEKLKDIVDVYLVDFKYATEEAGRLSLALNYFEVATQAILQMRKNQPKDVIDNGVMQRGVIVRHLVLPGLVENSKLVLDWVAKNLGANTIVSLMSQYTPTERVASHPLLFRKLKPIEYKSVVSYAEKLGFDNAFVQDMDSSSEKYIPDFLSNNDFKK